MPQGFQAFDASGNLIIDVTSKLTRLSYSGVISSAGSHTDPIYATGNLFYTSIPLSSSALTGNSFLTRATVTVSGTTASWFYSSTVGPCLLIIGVYS